MNWNVKNIWNLENMRGMSLIHVFVPELNLEFENIAAKIGFTCSKSNMDIKKPHSWREHPLTKTIVFRVHVSVFFRSVRLFCTMLWFFVCMSFLARSWFPVFLKISTPTWGNDSSWLQSYFSKRLNQIMVNGLCGSQWFGYLGFP